MGCFGDLVRSRFLADALLELKHAHETTQKEPTTQAMVMYSFDEKEREEQYKFYLKAYGLLSEMHSTVITDEKNIINYLQIDHISFAYSKSKKLVQDMIEYGYNLYGNIPLYQKKHNIAGSTVYAVLTDLRFHLPPI